MIDKNSTPIDLAYDELLRVLYQMEDSSGSDTCVAGNLIDLLIEEMGVKGGFVPSMDTIYNDLDSPGRAVLMSVLYEAVNLSEASLYLSKELDDAPSSAYVMRAKSLISNSIIVLGNKQQYTQEDMFPAMVA